MSAPDVAGFSYSCMTKMVNIGGGLGLWLAVPSACHSLGPEQLR